jgi:hypothetical protein
MSLQSILNNVGVEFPHNHNYNFASISKSIFDRFYSQYISRLQAVGYSFPPPQTYQQTFGEPIGTSLILSKQGGLTLNPPLNYRWLVFHSDAPGPGSVLIARTIVLEGHFVALLGEKPEGLFIKLGADDVINAVTVPLFHADAMGQSVIRV